MRKAFTLMELIIVIGIMGIMAAGMVSYLGQGAAKTSRDAKRKSDLEVIRSSLEKYRGIYGDYPVCGTSCDPNNLPNLPILIPTGTVDPRSAAGNTYIYTACATSPCKTYTLCSNLEKGISASTPNINASCGGATCGNGCYFSVKSP